MAPDAGLRPALPSLLRPQRPRGRPAADALRVLDDLQSFCRDRRVRGSVSLSGGNPLLHPDFTEIYRAAAERGFGLCILGNPAPRGRIEELIDIRRPGFFQVSLEGLPEHNDWVRGAGHFERTTRFLRDLKELGVSSMVMLTLTEQNIDQVLPLAALLRGLVDDFHFNRLAMVGEGANLRLPTRERYARFLAEYLEAAARDPALGIKDNLINILRRERGAPPFGGCTGFGCGAAFNFIALLPDGEVHACRKFPSPIGNAVRDGIAAVYESAAARAYRAGCSACRDCAIRPVCGGCLAVAHGFGLDPLRDRDPLCFSVTAAEKGPSAALGSSGCLRRAPARLGRRSSPALHLDPFDQPLSDCYCHTLQSARGWFVSSPDQVLGRIQESEAVFIPRRASKLTSW